MCFNFVRPKLPTELGDAMLVAAGVLMVALFVMLYVALPTTTVSVETASHVREEGRSTGQAGR